MGTTRLRSDSETYLVRSYEHDDRDAVFELLYFLPILYPGSGTWLGRRLTEIVSGDALGFVVSNAEQRIVGVLLAKPKDAARMKICTLFVEPRSQNCGVGSILLDRVLDIVRASKQTAYITVAETVDSAVRPLLDSRGFSRMAVVANRYGFGRNENVYVLD